MEERDGAAALRHLAAVPRRQPGVQRSRQRRGIGAVALLILMLTVGQVMLQARYVPAIALLGVLSAAVLAQALGWWRSRRAIALALLCDVALLFLYAWSLDERIHIVIRATRAGYVASAGGNVASIHKPSSGGGLALYGKDDNASFVGPAAEASPPAPIWSPLLVLGGLATAWAPGPAWADIHITSGEQTGAIAPGTLPHAAGWVRNRRGEFEASRASTRGKHSARLLLAPHLPATFTFSADLLRAGDSAGVLVGLGRRPFLFEVQVDRRTAEWLWWHPYSHASSSGRSIPAFDGWRGKLVAGGMAVTFDVDGLSMVQRVLRTILPPVLCTFVLALLALLLSGALAVLPFRAGRGKRVRMPWFRERLPRPGILAALAASAGTAASAALAWFVFGGVPNVQDSVAYLFQARTLAAGRLWSTPPNPPSFFWQDALLIYHGHWFGKYPPGWPLLLAVGWLAHAPWLVNPLLLGLTLILLYLIGCQVYDAPVAVLATLLALGSPILLFLAGTYLAHIATLCCVLAFIYLLVRWNAIRGRRGDGPGAGRRQRADLIPVVRYLEPKVSGRRFRVAVPAWATSDAVWLIPAGFLLGFAAITRQLDTIAFSLPFLLLFWRRLGATVWLVLGASGPVAVSLAYNRALTGSFLANRYTLLYPFDRIGFGAGVGGPGRHEANFTLARGLLNMSTDLNLLQWHLFGWPAAFTLALAVMPFVLGRATRWDAIFALSAISVVVAYVLYFDPGGWYGIPRYYTLAIPALALLSARGFQELCRVPGRTLGGRATSRTALALPALLLVAFWTYEVTTYLPSQIATFANWNRDNRTSIGAVERARLRDALVFQVPDASSGWWPYGSVFNDNTLSLNGSIVYARDEGCADAVLIRHYPGRAVYRLDRGKLTPFTPRPCTTEPSAIG